MKTLLPRLALIHILQHPMRSLITVLGVSLGVAVVLAVSILNDAAYEAVARTVEDLGSGKTDIWIEELGEKTSSIGSRQEGFSEDVARRILNHPAVASVHPIYEVRAIGSSSRSSRQVEIYLYGVDQAQDQMVRGYVLSAGKYPTDSRQVLVGAVLAQELGISPGDMLFIHSPNGLIAWEVSGFLSPNEGTGLLRNNRVVFADLATVQKTFTFQGKITGLNVVLQPARNPSDVVEQIRTLLPVNVVADIDPLMVAAKRDESGSLRAALVITSFFAVVVGGFLVYNTLISTAEESRREIALLRLAGMTPGQAARFFLSQAFAYAFLGTGAGIGLGILLGGGLLQLTGRVLSFQTMIFVLPSFSSLLAAIGTGLIVTLVVALPPARKIARVTPMAAFRENNIDRHTSLAFGVRHLVGSILIALALILGLLDFPGILYAIVRVSAPLPLFAGLMMVLRYILPPILQAFFIFWRKVFGVPGSLAVRSLLLRLDQTVITTGAIAISLSIAVGTLGMVQSMKATTFNWLDKARWADLLVFSFSGTEMEGSLLTDVLDYPFVKDVNPIRYFFISYDHPQLSDGGFLFQAVDPLPFQEFAHLEVVEGNTAEAMAALSRGPAILINEGLAQRLDLKQADVLSLTTNLGPVDFTIAGTVSDYSDFVHRMGKIVYGSYETLEKYWGVSGFTVLQIHITPLLSSENAKDRLWQGLSNQHDVKILTHEEEKADIGASIDSIFASTYGIVAAIGLIAVMGVFNTIFMNVLFQIREFAILKTLGLQTSQIRTMVFVEALTMACVGALFGLAAGVWIAGQVNLGIRELMGMVIQFHIPWTMMGGILLSLPLAAFLATLYPQRIACGLSIARVMQFSERL